jgi:hypothetical protein
VAVDLRVVRHVDANQVAGRAAQILLAPPEVQAAADEVPLEALGVVAVPVHGHVVRLALVDRRRLGQRGAAPPLLDNARVARRGHRALAEVGTHIDPVLVDPRDRRLGLGQVEALVDEGTVLHVELPHHGGVRAAPGQLDQRPPVVRLEHHRAVPHPVLVLVGSQGVHVENQLPAGPVLAVLLQGGPAPEPARVVGVLPEVVQILSAPADVWDAIIGVEHLTDFRLQLVEPVRAGEVVDGLRVAVPHPGQGVVPGDVFEPEVRVGLISHVASLTEVAAVPYLGSGRRPIA